MKQDNNTDYQTYICQHTLVINSCKKKSSNLGNEMQQLKCKLRNFIWNCLIFHNGQQLAENWFWSMYSSIRVNKIITVK